MSLFLPRLTLLVAGLAPAPQETAPGPEPTASPVEQAAPGQEPAPAPAGDVPAAPERRVDALFEGALVGAVDGQDFAETPGYRRLLELLSHYDPEQLKLQVEAPFDFHAALADPDAWRGRIASVRGIVGDLKAIRLLQPIGEQVDTYRAWVVEADGSEGVVVDFLRAPPRLELRADVVDFEGVFYRTLRYENVRGEMKDLPYLVAREIRWLDPDVAPRSTKLDWFVKILIGAAVTFLVVRILMSMRDRKGKDPSPGAMSQHIRRRALAPLKPKPKPPAP